VGGLLGAGLILALLGVEDTPAIVIVILWAVVSAVLAAIVSKHGL
jgi:phosphate/sulfate permease